jgi:two-component system, NtrC family, sensor kinase
MMDERPSSLSESGTFVLPRRGWLKLHRTYWRSAGLMLVTLITIVAGLFGALRRIGEFQQPDFQAVRTPEGFFILDVAPRSGAARAGLVWSDVVVGVDGVPAAQIKDLSQTLYAHRISSLAVVRDGQMREVAYYPPVAQVDVQYLLVAFAAMFTLAVAGVVFLGHPNLSSSRFLALAAALFAALVIPFPTRLDTGWQPLLLVRDFGRLSLAPLLVVFFASFPAGTTISPWLWLVFAPSALVAGLKSALAIGFLPPVVGDLLLPEALDRATAVLAVVGVVTAIGLAVRAYVRHRSNPARRRQVEWVALGAAAGFTPYLLLSLIPQIAGAELQVLTWISLLPLALVPLGVASSLLEFRLWDLEDIARQVVATGLAVLLGGVSFAFLNYAITQFAFRLGNVRNFLAVAGGVLLAALTVPARRLLLESLERLQYRERLAARRALTTFAEEAVSHRDPEELLQRLSALLRDAFAVEPVVTYLALGGKLYPASEGKWPTLTADQVQGLFPTAPEQPLRTAGIWHRFPLERDGRVIGVVYCGRRHGELPLGHGERRLVGALAAQAALALENSLLLVNLRRQIDEHRLLEDYLERIFQFSAAALFICDASGRVLRANQKAATLLRSTTDRLVGEYLHRLVALPKDLHELLPTDVTNQQVRFRVGDEWRTGVISTSAIEVEPGRFDGRVVTLDDISDQLRLEQRLADQERMAALGRLAAGLAHEVNTPVTGIASYAQLLRELTAPSDPRAPLVLKLEEQAFRVARIVTNLLELARPSGFERQPVDLAQLVREELSSAQAEADRIGVATKMPAAEGITASVNRVQFELVLHNLLRNALQATPRGGEVEVRIGGKGDTAWLEVRDTGPGVPRQLRERIFEPFVTSREGRGGTGLGLAITRDIVVAHGGSIVAEPNEPHGTVMRIELPVQGENG